MASELDNIFVGDYDPTLRGEALPLGGGSFIFNCADFGDQDETAAVDMECEQWEMATPVMFRFDLTPIWLLVFFVLIVQTIKGFIKFLLSNSESKHL